MPKFTVTYRKEFYANIEAENGRIAQEKFEIGECEYKLFFSTLHPKFIEVTDEFGDKVFER